MRYPGLACVAALMAVAAPAAAQTKEAVRRYAIAAGPLDDGLRAFGLQSGQQLLYPPALTAGRRTAGVQGDHSAHAALERLLAETGLAFRRTRPNTWVVFDPSTRAQADAAEAVVIDEVIVTGTHLRGAVDGPSPVVVVSRDRLDREGRATVAEALAALPQNFGGTANEAAIGNGGDRTGSNANYANGVNLRGLGSDATLVPGQRAPDRRHRLQGRLRRRVVNPHRGGRADRYSFGRRLGPLWRRRGRRGGQHRAARRLRRRRDPGAVRRGV